MVAGTPEPLKIHKNRGRVVQKRGTPLSEKTVAISKNMCEMTIDNYDIVVLRGKNWKINSFEDNNYVINLIVGRES